MAANERIDVIILRDLNEIEIHKHTTEGRNKDDKDREKQRKLNKTRDKKAGKQESQLTD